MRIFFLAFIFIFTLINVNAQQNDTTQQIDHADSSYYVNFSGDKTYFKTGAIQWSDKGFRILDKDKKGNYIINSGVFIEAKNVKKLVYGATVYMNFPGEFGRNNLIAVIAYSDKYILGFEDSGQKSLYVYDLEGKALTKRMMVNNKKYYKKAYTEIQFYFRECADFLNLFSAFIEQFEGYDSPSVMSYISMFKCGSKELFKD
jgi:hypothetical protein